MADDLIRTQFKIGQLAERGLKRADKLGLQLTVKLVAAVFLLHVPAHIGVEEQGICDLVRVYAGAAHRNV